MFGAIREIHVYQNNGYRSVSIERRVAGKSRTNEYLPSSVSIERLHKAVSRAVNKGEAKIDLYERGYFVEF